MSNVLQLDGATLVAGPPPACDGGTSTGASDVTPLELQPCCKGYLVSTGRQRVNLASANAPATMPALGASSTVTQAHTLYVRTWTPMQVVVTYQGIASPTLMPVYGTLLIEADPNVPIVGLAVQGSGTLEWAAYGNA